MRSIRPAQRVRLGRRAAHAPAGQRVSAFGSTVGDGDPFREHKVSLAHTPERMDKQKHTFIPTYFRSPSLQDMVAVSHDETVAVEARDGRLVAVAQRALEKGEILERGILRGVEPEAIPDAEPNPALFRLGQDFLFGLNCRWSEYASRPGPPFLASGALPQYSASSGKYNVELKVRESQAFDGFDVFVVASEDVPAGAALTRRTGSEPAAAPPRNADLHAMSEQAVEEYIKLFKEMDARAKSLTGIEQQAVHEDAIREHARASRNGEVPAMGRSRCVTVPHPTWPGFGVFAKEDIAKGSIIEYGLMNEVSKLNGDIVPYVFTWNAGGQRFTDGTPNRWCTGAGNSMFYNSDDPPNCRMYRFYDHLRYLIVAREDIREGEEVMHLYASSSWRKCFVQDDSLPKVLPTE